MPKWRKLDPYANVITNGEFELSCAVGINPQIIADSLNKEVEEWEKIALELWRAHHNEGALISTETWNFMHNLDIERWKQDGEDLLLQ